MIREMKTRFLVLAISLLAVSFVLMNLSEATPANGVTSQAPPVASVTITSPQNGTLTAFSTTLSSTPDKSTIMGQGTVVPMITITPQNSSSTVVSINYSNTGGSANGTLSISNNGTQVASIPLLNFSTSSATTFPVTLGLGTNNILATLNLLNSAGSSNATSMASVNMSNTVNTLNLLDFNVTGPVTADYFGKLTNQPGGLLADSAPSFSSLTLPPVATGGQSVTLKEPIRVHVQDSGNMTITVTVAANSSVQSASVTYKVKP